MTNNFLEKKVIPGIKKVRIQTKPPHKIGFFGGSFNPPHIGHVFLVQYVMSMFRLEGVIVSPCNKHAFNKDLLDFKHRFEMCKLAFLNWRQPVVNLDIGTSQNNIVVSDVENTLDVSYTVDVLKYLIKELPRYKKKGDDRGVELSIILGTDTANDLREKKWKDSNWILDNIKIIEVPRSVGTNGSDFTIPSMSSTEVRNAIKEKKSIIKSVPLRVSEYIVKNDLYL